MPIIWQFRQLEWPVRNCKPKPILSTHAWKSQKDSSECLCTTAELCSKWQDSLQKQSAVIDECKDWMHVCDTYGWTAFAWIIHIELCKGTGHNVC